MGSGDQAVPFPISFRTTFNCTSATNGAGTYENSGFAEREYEKSRVLIWYRYGGSARCIAIGI